MKVSKEDVERLAHLSRLSFTEDEAENMLDDMQNMLTFVEAINRLELDGVEPLVYMTNEEDVLRTDEVVQHITKDDALKNAPDRDTDYFKVPKVLTRQ
jgi:aspartyl-tRNA(Asn)/glutamyl-tRNA(Gln) amidotransferase subunit C